MHRPSLNHLATPILATLLSLSSCPLRAQQSIAAAPQIFALASDPPSPLISGNTLFAAAPTSLSYNFSLSAASSSADQPQTTPQTKAQPPQPDDSVKQTQRILGIIPNFRSVSANVKLPPQSVKDKFIDTTEDSFDYSSIVIPATIAAVSLAGNSTPEFGGGGLGYARYLWHSAADQTIENYMVEFIVPSITHEDNRFYTLGHGSFFKRSTYALGRAFITRSDSGKEVFNISEIVGAGASAGISSLYYPTRERTFSNVGGQWGLDVGIDAGTFVFKEFWPDINHRLFHASKPKHATEVYP